MVIRQQKAKKWSDAIRWAERGIALYGAHAARPEAVEDLKKRISGYQRKLNDGGPPERRSTVISETSTEAHRTMAVQEPATETLTCETCGKAYQRHVARGRKPKQCPECRLPAGN
jgi:hypothetical protein